MPDDAFSALLTLDAAAREHAALETPPTPAAAGAGARAVVVRVAGRALQIALEHVREVRRCPPLAPVPGAQAWLAGAVAWQGHAVAVVDLARLAFDSESDGGESLLLCTVGETRLGLRVDAVLDMESSADEPAALAEPHWLAETGGRHRLDLPALLADDLFWQTGRWPRARRGPPPEMLEGARGH